MAPKRQLIARWETPEGQQVVEDLYRTFTTGVTVEQLHAIVSALPYVDEVAPHLDLRGLRRSRKVIFVRFLDLPGVRAEYAALRGNLSDGNWSEAVFDEADVTQLDFELDLTRASFVNVNAKGTRFDKSTLNEANFREAKLVGAYLREASCQRADFSGADLRDATCTRADFRGANLSGANLKGAVLGNILFDENTTIQGVDFTGASMSRDFEAFVIEHGVQLKTEDDSEIDSELAEIERAEIEATIALVEARLAAGQVQPSQVETLLTTLKTIRQRLTEDPGYNWGPLVESLPEYEQKLFKGAYKEGSQEYIHFL